MYPKLFHIYGPLYINSYGVAIALGLLVLVWLVGKDTVLKKYLSANKLHNLFLLGLVSGVVGGRVLYLINNWYELEHWYDVFAVWNGGLSITGVIIGALISGIIYLRKHNIAVLRVTDRFAIYAPLAQAFGRIGCFIAGCCHGTVCQLPWSITYTDHDAFAPLYVPLHPTQLYSATALLGIFLLLRYKAHKHNMAPGQLTALYLLLISAQRFIIDFWRGDRLFFESNMFGLSVHQWLSGGIVIGAGVLYVLINKKYSLIAHKNPSIHSPSHKVTANTQGER